MGGACPGVIRLTAASLVAQLVKNPPAMRSPWVEKIPWRRRRLPTPLFWPTEFYGLYSPWGHRVGHDQATCTFCRIAGQIALCSLAFCVSRRYFEALVSNMSFVRYKEVYAASAEVLGLVLRYLSGREKVSVRTGHERLSFTVGSALVLRPLC